MIWISWIAAVLLNGTALVNIERIGSIMSHDIYTHIL